MIVISPQVGQKHKPSELKDQQTNIGKLAERKKNSIIDVSSDKDSSSRLEDFRIL